MNQNKLYIFLCVVAFGTTQVNASENFTCEGRYIAGMNAQVQMSGRILKNSLKEVMIEVDHELSYVSAELIRDKSYSPRSERYQSMSKYSPLPNAVVANTLDASLSFLFPENMSANEFHAYLITKASDGGSYDKVMCKKTKVITPFVSPVCVDAVITLERLFYSSRDGVKNYSVRNSAEAKRLPKIAKMALDDYLYKFGDTYDSGVDSGTEISVRVFTIIPGNGKLYGYKVEVADENQDESTVHFYYQPESLSPNKKTLLLKTHWDSSDSETNWVCDAY